MCAAEVSTSLSFIWLTQALGLFNIEKIADLTSDLHFSLMDAQWWERDCGSRVLGGQNFYFPTGVLSSFLSLDTASAVVLLVLD